MRLWACRKYWISSIALMIWAYSPFSLGMFSLKKDVSCAARSTRRILFYALQNENFQKRDFSLNAAHQKSKRKDGPSDDVDSTLASTLFSIEKSFKDSIGTSLDNSPTLVLNADYTPLSHAPLSIWHWQDAIRAVLSGKARIVSEYPGIVVRSVSCALTLPSVICLNHFYKQPMKIPTMTRRYVYIRDDFHCQYCMKKFTADKLSLDHVIPRSKGGRLVWTNTVTACHSCNAKKGNVAVEDLPRLGMRLPNQPRAPTIHEIQQKYRAMRKHNYHPHWRDFL